MDSFKGVDIWGPFGGKIAISEALNSQIQYVSQNSKYYKELFSKYGIPEDYSQFQKLPFTTKEDIAKSPNDFLCVTKREIVEYVTTSGTTSNPIQIGLTRKDLNRLAYNELQSLKIAGVTGDDVIQITTTLDKRFMAGMAYYLGGVELGAAVIRAGVGNLAFQLENILTFNPTVLIAVPSFAYKLGLYLKQEGVDPRSTSVRKIVCIGEPIRMPDFSPNALYTKVSDTWGVPLHSTYASTEMATAFTECEYGVGGHVNADLIVIEVVDDEGNPVKPGELGELVATPLGVTGTPLLRYKTGDLVRIHTDASACKRSTPRVGPVEGRKGQMMKVKGTTVFPQQVINIIEKLDNAQPYFIEAKSSDLDLDQLIICLPDLLDSSEIDKIKRNVSQQLRVTPIVKSASTEYIISQTHGSKSRKPRVFIDSRTH